MKPTILYVEDDEVLRECLQDLISEDFDVVTAGNIDQAFELWVKLKPQILVTDYKLGQSSAEDLIKSIQSRGHKLRHVLVFSARSKVAMNEQITTETTIEWLQKPASFEQLKAVLDRLANDHKQHVALKSNYSSGFTTE